MAYITLKIDQDFRNGQHEIRRLKRGMKTLCKIGVKIENIIIYNTQRGVHIYMLIQDRFQGFEVTDEDLNMFQMVCNDDLDRVFKNHLRIKTQQYEFQRWNILFIRKFSISAQGRKLISKEEYNLELTTLFSSFLDFLKYRYYNHYHENIIYFFKNSY